jgi:hypothetical protein
MMTSGSSLSATNTPRSCVRFRSLIDLDHIIKEESIVETFHQFQRYLPSGGRSIPSLDQPVMACYCISMEFEAAIREFVGGVAFWWLRDLSMKHYA